MARPKKSQVLTCQYLSDMVYGRTWDSTSTRQCYEALILKMHDFANGGFEKRVIDDQFCEDFAAFLLTQLKASSTRSYLEHLGTLLNTIRKSKKIKDIPSLNISSVVPKVEATDRVFLDKNELEAMKQAECPADSTKKAFLFCCYTGLLKNEIRNLNWDRIRLSGSGLVLSRDLENSSEKVKIPLIEPAQEILKSMEDEYASLPDGEKDDKVFHMRSNSTVTVDINAWADNAKLDKKINFMTSRHTFATMALRAGIDLLHVSRWCGFVNTSTAQQYLDLINPKLKTDAEMLETAFA